MKLKDTYLNEWFERDRAHLNLIDKETEQTILEFRDKDISELIENGILDPDDYHKSMFEYAYELGLIDNKPKPKFTLNKDGMLYVSTQEQSEPYRGLEMGTIWLRDYRDEIPEWQWWQFNSTAIADDLFELAKTMTADEYISFLDRRMEQ